MTKALAAWRTIAENVAVPARPPQGLWTPVLDHVVGPGFLRITARGRWKPLALLPECGADGFASWALGRDALLTKRAPLGALIARVGGSNISNDEATVLVVGSHAVLALSDKDVGPLYLTINDSPLAFDDNEGSVTVAVEQYVDQGI